MDELHSLLQVILVHIISQFPKFGKFKVHLMGKEKGSVGGHLEGPVGGQRNFLVPMSLCPGTRARTKIPGQTPLSRDVPGQNEFIFI